MGREVSGRLDLDMTDGQRWKLNWSGHKEHVEAEQGVVAPTFSTQAQEAEAGGSLVGDQPGLCSKTLSRKKEKVIR